MVLSNSIVEEARASRASSARCRLIWPPRCRPRTAENASTTKCSGAAQCASLASSVRLVWPMGPSSLSALASADASTMIKGYCRSALGDPRARCLGRRERYAARRWLRRLTVENHRHGLRSDPAGPGWPSVALRLPPVTTGTPAATGRGRVRAQPARGARHRERHESVEPPCMQFTCPGGPIVGPDQKISTRARCSLARASR